jgi:hypothetical protein
MSATHDLKIAITSFSNPSGIGYQVINRVSITNKQHITVSITFADS